MFDAVSLLDVKLKAKRTCCVIFMLNIRDYIINIKKTSTNVLMMMALIITIKVVKLEEVVAVVMVVSLVR